ncbi:hypothetical protein MWU58_09205 [Flavobacteriaceae bacterium S0825]|uniref:hypothetical protein n=1 Tax=Gaetbulibacter sp. S0825 TaxID=2720084 RepID=UPI0014308328|nr:hypothetical protein [Gaetbulibacter sp. S0825]MCK0109470.1 hypothetical protein [Flavobacteriaceae bacterium S0825]NIX65105.1 hypothetical protein [Gaetbulibacter sp. S0825]
MYPKKKILLLVLFTGMFLLLFGIWYKYQYSMDTAKEFQVNSPDYSRKIVIATQGSEFKNMVTKEVINHFEEDSIFIKVIDVSSLPKIQPKDYNAVVLMHTWENWKPPAEVKEFINRTASEKSKIIVLTTSGQGSYKMDGVDAITGESNLEEIETFSQKIIDKLSPLLKPKL